MAEYLERIIETIIALVSAGIHSLRK